MVALPGGTTASAKLWLLAFPDGMPASSRIEEPSAVMKGLPLLSAHDVHRDKARPPLEAVVNYCPRCGSNNCADTLGAESAGPKSDSGL